MNSRVLTFLMLVTCGGWLAASPASGHASIVTDECVGASAHAGVGSRDRDRVDSSSVDMSVESPFPTGDESPTDQAIEKIFDASDGFGASDPPSSGSQLCQPSLGSFSFYLCATSARRACDELALVFPSPHPTGIMRPPCDSNCVMVSQFSCCLSRFAQFGVLA